MATTTNLKAIVLTTNAKATAISKGADATALMNQAVVKTHELRVLLAQIIALHPGGDANLTALNNELTALT